MWPKRNISPQPAHPLLRNPRNRRRSSAALKPLVQQLRLVIHKSLPIQIIPVRPRLPKIGLHSLHLHRKAHQDQAARELPRPRGVHNLLNFQLPQVQELQLMLHFFTFISIIPALKLQIIINPPMVKIPSLVFALLLAAVLALPPQNPIIGVYT